MDVRPEVRWIGSRRAWEFWLGDYIPPATITFGYLSRPLDKFRYASSEFQYIAFDELTDFSEEDYLFLFSRLRRSAGLKGVPLRMRSASNPGGRGHAWVKGRFIPEGEVSPLPAGVLEKHGRLYVPSRIADNPHLDGEEYRQSLLHLPSVERERLMNGDWSVQEKTLIPREWLRYYVEGSAQCAGLGDPRPTEQMELMDAAQKIGTALAHAEDCGRVRIDEHRASAEENLIRKVRRGR